MSKKRKYDESYVNFGFTFVTERDGTQKPQCFLCGKVLANGSMKPAKLSEHLKTVHPGNVSDSIDDFRTNLKKPALYLNWDSPRHKNHVLRHLTRLLTVLLSKRSHTLSRKH